MMNRESASDAFNIQQGACNPRGIARSLVKAIDQAAEEGGSRAAGQSPAVRQILHQMFWVMFGTDPYDAAPCFRDCTWEQDYHACEALAKQPARVEPQAATERREEAA
jgi:hypothetical protein